MRLLALALFVLIATATPAMTAPEAYPTRPITFVVGFAPGGGADVFARALAEGVRGILPQPLVVENRPGAGGTAANAYASSRAADGYTVLFAHAGSSIITPIIANQPLLKWDAFDTIARIHGEEEWLMVHPDAPWKTMEELVAFAKANPRKVRVAGSSPRREPPADRRTTLASSVVVRKRARRRACTRARAMRREARSSP